jgi:hypothetical protein
MGSHTNLPSPKGSPKLLPHHLTIIPSSEPSSPQKRVYTSLPKKQEYQGLPFELFKIMNPKKVTYFK